MACLLLRFDVIIRHLVIRNRDNIKLINDMGLHEEDSKTQIRDEGIEMKRWPVFIIMAVLFLGIMGF